MNVHKYRGYITSYHSMHIHFVETTNIDLTDALRQYVEEKLQRLASKHIDKSDESAKCDVQIGKTTEHHQSGEIYRAEFSCHVAGKDLFAAAEEEDLYAAIDEARKELRRQLRSYNEKRETMLKKGGRKLKEMLHQQPEQE